MGYQIAGDPTEEGADASAAPLEQASPDTALAVDPGNPESVQQGDSAPVPTGGKVTLAPVAPLRSVTLPPLEDGGEGIVIAEAGTEVDAETARRAHEAAQQAGFKLRTIT